MYHMKSSEVLVKTKYSLFSTKTTVGPTLDVHPDRENLAISKKSENVPNRSNNHKTNSSAGPLPELVEVRNGVIHEEGDAIASTGNVSASTSSKPDILKKDLAPLEPAFLSEEDYPPGWLVYHPVLGLTSVEEANQKYEQQSSKKHVNEENLLVLEENQS